MTAPKIYSTFYSINRFFMVQGYTLHQKRRAEKGAAEIRQVLALLSNTLESHGLVSDDGRSVLSLVALTLFIASSSPEQKDLLIRLVVNLISA